MYYLTYLFDIGDRLIILAAPLKLALVVEAENWMFALGKSLNAKYKAKLDDIVEFITDYTRRLAHPIQDLDDVRFAMSALVDIRNNEIRMDTDMYPIEVHSNALFSVRTIEHSLQHQQ